MAEDPRNRARQRDENRKGESSFIFDHFLERVHRRSSMGGTDIQRSLSVPLDKSKVYLKTTSPQLQPSPLDQIRVRARD